MWFEEFLVPSLNTAWEALRPGGTLALNINQKNQKEPFVQEMVKYLDATRVQTGQATFRGVIAYFKDPANAQPIWVWNKLAKLRRPVAVKECPGAAAAKQAMEKDKPKRRGARAPVAPAACPVQPILTELDPLSIEKVAPVPEPKPKQRKRKTKEPEPLPAAAAMPQLDSVVSLEPSPPEQNTTTPYSAELEQLKAWFWPEGRN